MFFEWHPQELILRESGAEYDVEDEVRLGDEAEPWSGDGGVGIVGKCDRAVGGAGAIDRLERFQHQALGDRPSVANLSIKLFAYTVI
jgi:hypothetical protein